MTQKKMQKKSTRLFQALFKKQRNVCITGAGGFIGSHLTSLFLKQKKYSCLFLFHPHEEKQIKKLKLKNKNNFSFCAIDLLKSSFKPFASFENYIHLAGSTKSEEKDHNCNVLLAQKLCKNINPKVCKHIIFTSTMAVYDNFFYNKNPKTHLDLKTEVYKLNPPISNYSKSKNTAEKIFYDFAIKNKIKLTILRLPTVFGDGCRKDGLFCKLNKLARQNSFLSRINWPAKISFISVDVLCKLFIFLLNQKTKKSQLICPFTEHKTLTDITAFLYKKQKKILRPLKISKYIFKIAALYLKLLLLLKQVLPHKIWNLVWQAYLCIESNMVLKRNNKVKININYKPTIQSWIKHTKYLL